MADYGRHGDADYRERSYGEYRDRDYRRERDPGYERSRRGNFFGSRDEEREDRGGFFGSGRDVTPDRESRYRRERERDESRYGYDDDRRGLPVDETSRLIASNKVEGTAVYGREGERLGTIYNFMVDKYSGQVEYAVMRYGGFLGMGQRYYPLPWRILTYDTREGGYRIDLTDRDMQRAPSFDRNEEPRFSRDYGRRVHNWYGLDY
jgi:hypothetical protein